MLGTVYSPGDEKRNIFSKHGSGDKCLSAKLPESICNPQYLYNMFGVYANQLGYIFIAISGYSTRELLWILTSLLQVNLCTLDLIFTSAMNYGFNSSYIYLLPVPNILQLVEPQQGLALCRKKLTLLILMHS